MRGAPSWKSIHRVERRIIPAYAGSTLFWTGIPTREEDHPRVCGEHVRLCRASSSFWGSSPRMRGAPAGCGVDHPSDRIIPAYAGSTNLKKSSAISTKDHPRVCGEHWNSPFEQFVHPGSSPRMRGARPPMGGPLPMAGIIPAYAGSTCTTIRKIIHNWDHPRVCGEHGMSLPLSVL